MRMANIVLMMFGKLCLCVSMIWELQEMRFAALFDDLTYIAFGTIMAAVSCFIAIRRR